MQVHDADSNAFDWERLRPVLDEMMDGLGKSDREAVLLRFFARRSFHEIGSALGLSHDAARMRVDRALEKLRANLARRGAKSTVAALGLLLTEHAAVAAPSQMAEVVAATAMGSASLLPGASAGLIPLMTTSKYMAASVGLALAFGIFSIYRHAEQSRSAEAAGVVIKHQIEALRNKSAAAEKQALALARKASAESKEAGSKANITAAKADAVGNGKAFLAAHPEVAVMISNYARARATARYYELMKRLELTPEQIDQFGALAAQLEEGVGIYSTGQAPSMEIEIGDLTKAGIEARIRDLLGAGGYIQYQDYTRTLDGRVRSVAEEMIKSSYFSDVRLTTAQANGLANIVAQDSSSYQSGRGVNLSSQEWATVIASAAGILSPPQLDALAKVREKSDFQYTLSEGIKRAVEQAKAQAGVPAGL